MTTTEIIKLDLEEIEEKTKDIDLLIKIKQIKKNLTDYKKIKQIYIELEKYYIFELKELKKELKKEEIEKELDKQILKKDFNNIFQILNVIEWKISENKIKEMERLFEKEKEYKYLLKDYLYKIKQSELTKIKEEEFKKEKTLKK